MAALQRLVLLLVLTTMALVEAGYDVKKIKSNPDGNLAVGFKKGHIISGMYVVIVPEGDTEEKREVLIKGSDVKDTISMKFDANTMVFSDWDGQFMLGDEVYTDKLGTLYFFHSDDHCNKKVYRSQGGDVVVMEDTSLDKSDCSQVREKVKRALDHFLTTPFRYMLSYPSIKLLNTPGFPGGDYVSGVTYGSIQCGQFTVTLPPGNAEEIRMIGISGPGVSESVAMKFDHGTKVFGRWDGYFYLSDKVFSLEPHTLVIEQDDGSCEKIIYEKQGIKIAATQKIPIKKEDCFLLKNKAFSVFEKIVGTSMISQEDRDYISEREEARSALSSRSKKDVDVSDSSKDGRINFISNSYDEDDKDSKKVHIIENDYYNEDMLLSRKYKSRKINNDFYDDDYSDYKEPKIRRIGDDYYDDKKSDYKLSKQEAEDLLYMKQKSQRTQQPSLHVSSTVVLPQQTLQGSNVLPLQSGNLATGSYNTRNQQLVSQSSTSGAVNLVLADGASGKYGYIKGNQLVLPPDSLKNRANTFFYQPRYDQNLREGSLDVDAVNLQYNNIDSSQQENTVNVQLNDLSQQPSVLKDKQKVYTANPIYGSTKGFEIPTSAFLIDDNDINQNLQYTTSQPIVRIQGNQADNIKESVMTRVSSGNLNKINVDDLANSVLNRALSSSQNIIAPDGSVNLNQIIPLSVQQGINDGDILNLQSNNVDLSETNKVSNIQVNDMSDDGQIAALQGTVRFARSIPVYTNKDTSDQNEVVNFQKNTVDRPGKVTNIQENVVGDKSPRLETVKLAKMSVDIEPVKTVAVEGNVRFARSIPVYVGKASSEPNEVINVQKNTVDRPGKVTNIQENEVRDNSIRLQTTLPKISVDIDPVKTIAVDGSVRLGRSITQSFDEPEVFNNQVTNVDGSVIDPNKPTVVTSVQDNTILAQTGPNGVQITPDMRASQRTTVNIPPAASIGAFNGQDGQIPQKLYIDSNVILKQDTDRQNQGSLVYYQQQSSQGASTNNLPGNLISTGGYNPNMVRFVTSPTVLTSQASSGQQVSFIPLSAAKLQSPVSTARQTSDVVNFQKNDVAFEGRSVSNVQINDVSQNSQIVVEPPAVQVLPRTRVSATGSGTLSAKYNALLSGTTASTQTGNVAVNIGIQPRLGNTVLVEKAPAKLPIPLLVSPKNVILM